MSDLSDNLLSIPPLTSSGRPKLSSTEVELFVANKVEIRVDDLVNTSSTSSSGPFSFGGGDGDKKPVLFKRENGLLFVTTHRLIWQMKQETSETYSFRIDRLYAGSLERIGASMFSREKIYCGMTGAENVPVAPPSRSLLGSRYRNPTTTMATTTTAPSSPPTRLVLKFSERGGEDVYESIMRAIKQKVWETDTDTDDNKGDEGGSAAKTDAPKPESQFPRTGGFSVSSAGVAGILRKDEFQSRKTGHTMSVGLSDLSQLMTRAQELVDIVDRIRHVRAEEESDEGAVQSSSSEFQEMLLSIGITSPVTRESAGSQFHKQLSRQLADFLEAPLEREGGLMQLTDAFCLFNRARGTELITPDDMVTACELWPKLKLKLTMAKLGSGVNVIQSAEITEEKILRQLESLSSSRDLSHDKGLNEFEVGQALGITPVLAREYMIEAEKRGTLCRDNAPDGVRFYRNFFMDTVM